MKKHNFSKKEIILKLFTISELDDLDNEYYKNISSYEDNYLKEEKRKKND